MSPEKQIEKNLEQTDTICADVVNAVKVNSHTSESGYYIVTNPVNIAQNLYYKGYRKADEVAREIFAELEENLNNLIQYYKEKRKYVTEIDYSEFEQRYCDIKIRTFEERLLKIAKLKKKYTEDTE